MCRETVAKLTVAARERPKGQIPVAFGWELESHCRPGVCAHYLPFKNTDDNLYYLQVCTLGLNSWVKHLGVLDPTEASGAKSYEKSLEKGSSP